MDQQIEVVHVRCQKSEVHVLLFVDLSLIICLELTIICSHRFELVEAKDVQNKPWQFVFDSRRLTVYFVSVVSSS